MRDNRVVIVGAGHAGVQAATLLAEARRGLEITLLELEASWPYERPPLSKEGLRPDAETAVTVLHRRGFYADQGINLVRGAPVTAIDRGAKKVMLGTGEPLPYDHLVLATGSLPLSLPVPGSELEGIAQLKTAQDAERLRLELGRRQRILVVGAGYIGLEVAAAAAKAGAEVTVLEHQDRVMARVTSAPVSRFYEDLHRAAGVHLQLGCTVQSFQGVQRVERILTTDGQVFEADLVVVAVGVRPNESLAQDAGLQCRDGVLIDERARTSDPAIYAIGDMSRLVSPGDPHGVRLESVQSATAQAKAAASDILGGGEIQTEVPWFWTVQHGVRLQTAGLRRDDDELLLRGDPATGQFSVLYLRSGRLAAIDTVGSLRDFGPGKRLIAAGPKIDRSRAVDSSIRLTEATDGNSREQAEGPHKTTSTAISDVSAVPASTSAIRVVDRMGAEHDVEWEEGQSLMEALRDAGLPVLASCGGTAACATCHVHLPPDAVEALGARSDDELDLLEDAEDYDPRTSRLSCQVPCHASLAGVAVRLAEEG